MKLSDFDYNLPQELIAQTALKQREQSRLLVVNKSEQSLTHTRFFDIVNYLNQDDLLVYNNTKVIPARLIGNTPSGAKVEFLLVEQLDEKRWLTMVKPGKKARPGANIFFGDGILKAEILGINEEGYREVLFSHDDDWWEILDKIGITPLPPYIKRDDQSKEEYDRMRYQTVYASEKGSSAAPTAGLHFTEKLLQQLKEKGITTTNITLHVGPGTFKPVKENDISKHIMHQEWYHISENNAKLINDAKKSGKRIVAVGTTSVRALESATNDKRMVMPGESSTRLMIVPGYKFKIVDKLITNFHLPKSTLLMLVSAIAGKDLIFKAYKEAVNEKYRFFSYGDAMFIH